MCQKQHNINIIEILQRNWIQWTLLIALTIALAALILTEAYLPMFLIFIALLFVLVMHKDYEIFIILLLVINHDFFGLLPTINTIYGNYSDLLFVAFFVAGIAWVILKKEVNIFSGQFNIIVLMFIAIVFVGTVVPMMNGQPLFLGIRAARGFLCIAFYFVFIMKEINVEKLFRYIVITGVALTILNNIQYLYYGSINIFKIEKEVFKFEKLQLLSGGYFTIFAPLVALGLFLKNRKTIYLLAFIYMVFTVIAQGQVRAIIVGFAVTALAMLIISKRILKLRYIFVISIILLLTISASETIRSSFYGRLYDLTVSEISGKQGNVGIRFDAFYYYIGEIMKSPWIGSGIWNDIYAADNPENIKRVGIYLSDIGIVSIGFHFGIVGMTWFIYTLTKLYQSVTSKIVNIDKSVKYLIYSYLIFGLTTAITINCFIMRDTVIYLALILAIIDQSKYSVLGRSWSKHEYRI